MRLQYLNRSTAQLCVCDWLQVTCDRLCHSNAQLCACACLQETCDCLHSVEALVVDPAGGAGASANV